MTFLTASRARVIRSAPAIRVAGRWRPLGRAAALLGVWGSSSAHAQSHAEQVNVYARALSATTFAEQACPGFRANASRLALMRTKAGIIDAEDETIANKLRESTASVTSSYERVGQSAWCADTYRLFGPDGTLVKGALGKKP